MTATVGGQPLATGYTYDDAGRLDVVTDPAGRAYDHGYDANGNRASLAHPNGAVTAYAYDTLNRLTSLGTTIPSLSRTVQSYAFTLGPAGNRTRIVEAAGLPQQRTLDYSYDALYRLTGETVTESLGLAYSKTFGYDPVGNRQTQTTAIGPAGSPGPNLQPGTIGYGYDDSRPAAERAARRSSGHGLRLGRQRQPHHEGRRGHLHLEPREPPDRASRRRTARVVEHAYDVDGNRVQTQDDAARPAATRSRTTSSTRQARLSHVVAEVDSSAATPTLGALYVRGDDLLSVMRPLVAAPASASDWQTRYYHADGIGSIRRLTDEAGNITDGYTYSAFGELLAHTGSDPQPYAFTGEPSIPTPASSTTERDGWIRGRGGSRDGSVRRSEHEPASLHRTSMARETSKQGQSLGRYWMPMRLEIGRNAHRLISLFEQSRRSDRFGRAYRRCPRWQ